MREKKAKKRMTQTQNQQEITRSYPAIDTYAVIGNLHTVALIGKNGSLDWCCLPRFDSPSVFGVLLDAQKGGFFRIAPLDEHQHIAQKHWYLPETNVLVTRFLTQDGVGELTDFMPIKQLDTPDYAHAILRSVTVVSGTLTFALQCQPACDFARARQQLTLREHGALFESDHLNLALSSSLSLQEDGQGGVLAHFTLQEGQSASFQLESSRHATSVPAPLNESRYQEVLGETVHFWRNWLARCQYQGRWREMVQRSALILKLLTYAPTGAMVAAPTTSLPEAIGGDRNWDYRYTWLRDASFSMRSLLTLGFTEEADAFFRWLEDRCHEVEANGSLQPLYTLDGKRHLPEVNLDHLQGYRNSAPVRIGNEASAQEQLDVYGEVMDAIYRYNCHRPISYHLWQKVVHLLDWLLAHWQLPDAGFWEVRGTPRHYVDSRVMSWIAFDRALRLARDRGLPTPLEKWTRASAEIYRQVMEQGWNPHAGSFVQAYENEALDASALLMILRDFASPLDPLMLKTLERIQRELGCGALVHRYSLEHAREDGLGKVEGTFNACSFWLAEALARAGRVGDARSHLEKLLSYSNEVGLYSEKLGPTGEALGNFPQALTHLALIRACSAVDRALNEA
jgi:GH15 family glucan-1,4-alpha-glucosidase